MTDDIVNSLRSSAQWIQEMEHESWLGTAELQREAAVEIERLRAAGDALAHLMPHAHLSVPCRPPQGTPLDECCSECAALAAWEEARRG